MTTLLSSDSKPLPERIRPSTFSHVFGQEHLISENSPFRRLVESNNHHAFIFWGPPGTGKTTLAQIVGQISKRHVASVSAVHASVKDLRCLIEKSLADKMSGQNSHILFVDEIHRLSKNQQDVLLPGLEDGSFRFIGATTENPSFSVNNAILSRCLTFSLKPLSKDALINLQKRALQTKDPLLANVSIDEATLSMVADAAKGDGRQCLNILAALAAAEQPNSSGLREINETAVANLAACLPLRYDREGDQHYDMISAFIKSIRASHPDAAIYYLARMIEAGEDPLFIARRLLICASEDVGNANPTALLLADSTFRAVEVLGLPEARIHLSQCATYLAASPKSNRAYLAINGALEEVRKTGMLEVPNHLRNAPTQFMKDQGFSKGYVYPHDQLELAKNLPYLPNPLKGKRFYEPIPIGTERQLIETLKQIRPITD